MKEGYTVRETVAIRWPGFELLADFFNGFSLAFFPMADSL